MIKTTTLLDKKGRKHSDKTLAIVAKKKKNKENKEKSKKKQSTSDDDDDGDDNEKDGNDNIDDNNSDHKGKDNNDGGGGDTDKFYLKVEHRNGSYTLDSSISYAVIKEKPSILLGAAWFVNTEYLKITLFPEVLFIDLIQEMKRNTQQQVQEQRPLHQAQQQEQNTPSPPPQQQKPLHVVSAKNARGEKFCSDENCYTR